MKSHLLHLKFTQRDQTCSAAGCTPSSTAAGQSSSILNAGTNTEVNLSSSAREHTELLSVLFPSIFETRFLKALCYSSWKENTQTYCPYDSRMKNYVRAVHSKQGMYMAGWKSPAHCCRCCPPVEEQLLGHVPYLYGRRAPDQERQTSRCHSVA